MSKKRDDSYFAADRRRKKKYMRIVVPIIIAVAAAGAAGAILYKPSQAAAISGIECNRGEQLTHHIHAHLDVFVDGQLAQVPSNIGILAEPSCFYWLHTHSTDGVIHIESPLVKNFTLGQFLDIWNKTNDKTGFFNSVSGKNTTVYVDGVKVEENYRDVPLESFREIVIAYGMPPSPSSIPHNFDFASKGLKT